MKDILNWAGDHPILAILIVWAMGNTLTSIVRLVMAPFIAKPFMDAIEREERNEP